MKLIKHISLTHVNLPLMTDNYYYNQLNTGQVILNNQKCWSIKLNLTLHNWQHIQKLTKQRIYIS